MIRYDKISQRWSTYNDHFRLRVTHIYLKNNVNIYIPAYTTHILHVIVTS